MKLPQKGGPLKSLLNNTEQMAFFVRRPIDLHKTLETQPESRCEGSRVRVCQGDRDGARRQRSWPNSGAVSPPPHGRIHVRACTHTCGRRASAPARASCRLCFPSAPGLAGLPRPPRPVRLRAPAPRLPPWPEPGWQGASGSGELVDPTPVPEAEGLTWGNLEASSSLCLFGDGSLRLHRPQSTNPRSGAVGPGGACLWQSLSGEPASGQAGTVPRAETRVG